MSGECLFVTPSPGRRQSCVSPATMSGSRPGIAYGGLAVVEQEDGLELSLRGAQEAQATLLRPGVTSLVRKHGAGRVWLDPERVQRGPRGVRATPSGPT